MSQKYKLQSNTQASIYAVLTSAREVPKVSVSYGYDLLRIEDGTEIRSITRINLRHENKFAPNLEMDWCEDKKQFRVYILTGTRDEEKRRSGYCIMTIKTKLEAAALVQFYAFICKNRANNKEESYGGVQAALFA